MGLHGKIFCGRKNLCTLDAGAFLSATGKIEKNPHGILFFWNCEEKRNFFALTEGFGKEKRAYLSPQFPIYFSVEVL
jgi:hypothetical protein